MDVLRPHSLALSQQVQSQTMCATAFTTWFVSSVNSSVGTAVSIGAKLAMRYYAQSPARTMLSVATVICREGVKFKVNAWINKRWQKRKTKISNTLKLTLPRTLKWPKRRWKRCRQTTKCISRANPDEPVAIEAALKFQTLAERRLEAAMHAFKNAEMELREAEIELEDAKIYVKKVRSHCWKTPQTRRCKSSSDIVFVEHPK